jgi:hypothetical protein
MLSIIIVAATIGALKTPDTGTAPATPSRTPAEIEATRMDTEGLVVVTLPNGAKKMDLQGRFQMESRVVVGADGQLVFQCDNGADHSKHSHSAVAATQTAPTVTKEAQ